MRIHAPSFKHKLYSLIPFIVCPDGEYSWHNWFAWKPVRVGSTIVFLETVERRKRAHDPHVPGISFIYEWVYRLPERTTDDV